MLHQPASRLSSLLPSDLTILEVYQRPTDQPTTSITAVGDLGFSGKLRKSAELNPQFLTNIAPFLKSADITFGNLESPLTSQKGLFSGSPQGAKILNETGFDLINVANNHIYDYGQAGFEETVSALSQEKIDILGLMQTTDTHIQSPQLYHQHDQVIGWLGFGRTLRPQTAKGIGYWEYDSDTIIQSTKQAKENCDTLIVSIHAGLMLLDYPDPTYREVAYKVQEAGADLILFHHAHVLQGVEQSEQNQFICHCLGNFLWDVSEGHVPALIKVNEQHEGAIFYFEFDAMGLCKFCIIPTYMDENNKVQWATGNRGSRILNRISKLSNALKNNYHGRFWRQRAKYHISFTTKIFWFHLRRGNWQLLSQLIQELAQGAARILRISQTNPIADQSHDATK